jgi:ATP-dependent helicase/nuclease subunit B
VQTPMDGIAKSDLPSPPAPSIAAFSYPADHPAVAIWTRADTGLLHRLQAQMVQNGAHPARTVVLLPYAQLRPLANRLWAQTFSDGFLPRFETSMNWTVDQAAQALGATDIHFDTAVDSLAAHDLLAQAGLSAQADVLAQRLVQCAQQLGARASAIAPGQRASWAQSARQNFALEMAGEALQWESAVARIALEWAAVSAYLSDSLFEADTVASIDLLVVVQGLQPDPLAAGLSSAWGDKLCVLPLAWPEASADVARGRATLHECTDAEDEAQRVAACALRHIEAGRFPLALVSSDRVLTRRVRAMLDGAGVQMRDENGWKLSTSAAASKLMTVLKAAVWNAGSDAVLDWFKLSPAFEAHLPALEAAMRREQLGYWRLVQDHPRIGAIPDLVNLCKQANAIRSSLSGRCTLMQWIHQLREALYSGTMWDALEGDDAGAQVLTVLRLEPAAFAALSGLAEHAAWNMRRMDLAEFTSWVNQTLESANFQPTYPQEEQVVILPMSQMLARPFAALVMAGCDEVRLSPSPEPPGTWTASQRAALGLPTREVLETVARSAWHSALQTPVCDVLWRTGDETGETLLPSTLVQLLQLDCASDTAAVDPRIERTGTVRPVLQPLPVGAALPLGTLSQSAYEDLRECPYRFFALRQLGLSQAEELDSEVGKRDFGNWLHEVLKRFHESLVSDGIADASNWPELMDVASAQAT